MKRLYLSISFVIIHFWANAQSRPNIVLFLVDDMGWQDCSVPFWDQTTDWNRLYHTPNMELLAKQGMKFTHAYAAPVCSPSRISLMTGMNPARHKVTNWTLTKNAGVDVKDSLLEPPLWNINGLSPVQGIERTVYATPLPELLKQAGYYTIHCGKAHFAAMETPAADPTAIGFDVNIAGHAAGGPGSYLAEKNYGNSYHEYTLPWGVPGLKQYHGTDVFLTEALTREALKALGKPVSEKKPFFLYMAHYAVHVPYASDDRFVKKYIERGLSLPEAQYAGLVEGMDKSLGDIMQYLKDNHLEKNTIILFMSDNGGYAGHARGGTPYTQNAPLRAGKGSVYEGGIREPMIVKWPGVVKRASVCNANLIIEDFFPTVLAMAGIKDYKVIQQVDGKSFIPMLRGHPENDTTRAFVWHFPNKWIGEEGHGFNFHSAVKQGDWKLVYNIKTGSKELYRLTDDISEAKDLSAVYPQKTKQLSHALSKSLRDYGAQMPLIKSTGKEAPMADEVP
ncbi:MAG: sulfatase [Chitinophagaceae bacterium]|nr:sulfatase [Chitinophagaceae bacterium]